MQGIFINSNRPKFKKDVKAYIDGVNLWNAAYPDRPKGIGNREFEDLDEEMRDPYGLVIEATSGFHDEFDGSLAEAQRQIQNGKEGFVPRLPEDVRFNIVGPDPRTSRKWYLTLSYNTDKHQWEVS